MREVVAAQPAAAMAMMRAMSAELGNMTRQVVDLKVRIAAQRLGTYLLSQVKEPAATQAEFRLPVTKGLLAPWLGCRAENLSRAFMALRAYGVETHGSRVVLHDVSRLRAYAGAVEPRPADGGASSGRRWRRCSATRSGCAPGGAGERLTALIAAHADDHCVERGSYSRSDHLPAVRGDQPALRLSAGARLSPRQDQAADLERAVLRAAGDQQSGAGGRCPAAADDRSDPAAAGDVTAARSAVLLYGFIWEAR